MMDEYGPNWRAVKSYLAELPAGFTFDALGKPHAADASVHRVLDWSSLRTVVNYAFPDAGPQNCAYLAFLRIVDEANSENQRLGQEHGLGQCVRNAIDDASELFCATSDMSKDFLDFVFLPEYDEPYPFCRYSILDTCMWIAAELVIAHVTPIHLFRDMWYWYRAGHWPCGWEGEWPEGRLIVF